MENWIRENLSNCLDCIVTDKMLTAILSIKDEDAFDNYFGNLLSEEVPEHRLFIRNCRNMLLSGKQKRSTRLEKPKPQPIKNAQQMNNISTKKSKSKYVGLYAKDGKVVGDTILLKGRRVCNCQATQHQLINNCLHCGRIVCEQEKSGPCLFCGVPVYTAEEEQRMIKAQTQQNQQKSSKENRKKNQNQEAKKTESLKKALAQRDRLLEYDRNSEKRTTVIDDEFDYFQENSVWLTDKEREKYERLKKEMHDIKHGSRSKRKIKVDFAGREITDDLPISKEYEQKIIREVAATASSSSSKWSTQRGRSELALAPYLDVEKPLYTETKKDAKKNWINDGLERTYSRVQDKEILEMQDRRQCLSMHQPWASLLVAGIKKHEGRVWYSEHRGRLWIASTAKEPTQEDIHTLEEFYRTHCNDRNIKFPKHYPTGSLLGCVNIENCLPQEEYRELYPDGESDSPYVFICTHPERLPVLIPVKGDHKIYDLPLKIHNTACKTLLRRRSK